MNRGHAESIVLAMRAGNRQPACRAVAVGALTAGDRRRVRPGSRSTGKAEQPLDHRASRGPEHDTQAPAQDREHQDRGAVSP